MHTISPHADSGNLTGFVWRQDLWVIENRNGLQNTKKEI